MFLHRLKPVSIIALLTTLVLLFAFQGDTILNKPVVILLIAIPLTLQTYFIFSHLVRRSLSEIAARSVRTCSYDRRQQFL